MKTVTAAGLALALLATSSAALAAEPTPSDKWWFALTPYVWATGLNGESGVRNTVAGDVIADVDVSFSDIVDNLDHGALIEFEFGKGRWTGLSDLIYIDISTDDSVVKGPLAANVDVELKQTLLHGGVAYAVKEKEGLKLDVLGGARYTDITTDITFQGTGPAGLGGQADGGESWVDPFVGARATWSFGKKWGLRLYGDVGGFGVNSDFSWQAVVNGNYRFSKVCGVSAGYRYYSDDYDKNDFVYDVEMAGFDLGFDFHW